MERIDEVESVESSLSNISEILGSPLPSPELDPEPEPEPELVLRVRPRPVLLIRPEPPLPPPPRRPLLRECWYNFKHECIFIPLLLGALSIPVLSGIHYTSRDPITELEAISIHSFSFIEHGIDPLTAIGNISVTFQARNRNAVLGFKHRYINTLVSVFYHEVLWSRSQVPRFSQRPKSSSNVTAYLVVDGVVDNVTCWTVNVSQSEIALRDSIDARVKQNSHTTVDQELRWFNLTCLVNVSMPTTSEAGRMSGKTCTKSLEPSNLVFQ